MGPRWAVGEIAYAVRAPSGDADARVLDDLRLNAMRDAARGTLAEPRRAPELSELACDSVFSSFASRCAHIVPLPDRGERPRFLAITTGPEPIRAAAERVARIAIARGEAAAQTATAQRQSAARADRVQATPISIAPAAVADVRITVGARQGTTQMAALAGALLAGALAVMAVARRTRVSPAGARRRGQTVLAASPQLNPRSLRRLDPAFRTPAGVVAAAPQSPYATSVRDALSRLLDEAEAPASALVVAVCAATPHDRSSDFAAALARTAAQSGISTLLLDANVRRPAAAAALGLDRDNFPAEESPDAPVRFAQDPESDVRLCELKPPRGALIPTLPEAALVEWIEHFRARHGLIIVDAAPAMSGIDAALTARAADRAIVVASALHASEAEVRAATRSLRRLSPGLQPELVIADADPLEAQAFRTERQRPFAQAAASVDPAGAAAPVFGRL